MAKRVNTRFVAILTGVIVGLTLMVVVLGLTMGGSLAGMLPFLGSSSEELEARGDQYLAQGRVGAAVGQYHKALYKRRDDPELIIKAVDAMREMTVQDVIRARRVERQVFQWTREATNLRPSDEDLLEYYYELIVHLAENVWGARLYDELFQQASAKVESQPDNLVAREFRGYALVNRIGGALKDDDHEAAYRDLKTCFEHDPENARVAHALAKWHLLDAARREQIGRLDDRVREIRAKAVEVSERALEVDPDDPERLLDHLEILLHPDVNRIEDAAPPLARLEASLRENPEPSTMVRRVADLLARLDREMISLRSITAEDVTGAIGGTEGQRAEAGAEPTGGKSRRRCSRGRARARR